jgi:UDP-hydrolysing UDP-N-acetyl-D-glucosamine 2-epimerase
MNIHLAHTMGGEVTGTIDESVRHAVTKLAHLHFAANEDARERIIRMGEAPEFVFNTGCPRIDEVKRLIQEHRASPKMGSNFFKQYKGVGPELEIKDSQFLIVMQHPVTTEYGQNREHMGNILGALKELAMPTILIWPNADAGSDEISKEIRTFREKENPQWLHAFTNLPFDVFIPLMDMAGCIVGNSSSPVREGAIIGVPAVNIGTREQGRMRGQNVLDVGYSKEEILAGIKKQLQHGKYQASYIYGDGTAGQKIVKILQEIDLAKVPIQKQINY